MNTKAFLFLVGLIVAGYFALGLGFKQIGIALATTAHQQSTIGPDNAAITIVHFVDYLNPGSRRLHNQITQLRAVNSDIKLIIRELPDDKEQSEILSRLALSAKKLNLYHSFYNYFMRLPAGELNRPAYTIVGQMSEKLKAFEYNLNARAISTELMWNGFLAWMTGIEGAPALIINGKVIDHDGYSIPELLNIIELERL